MQNSYEVTGGEFATYNVNEPTPLVFTFMSAANKKVGTITIKEDVLTFDGDADETAKAFIQYLGNHWGKQWREREERITRIESALPFFKLTPDLWEIDSPGEGSYYTNSVPTNTDYWHTLVEEEFYSKSQLRKAGVLIQEGK